MLRKALIGTGLLAVALALGAVACGGGEPESTSGSFGPRLVLERQVLDLGAIPVAQRSEARVTFRNGGDAPLRVEITSVRPAPGSACGCGIESFTVEPPEVQPGAAGDMVFVMNPPEGTQGMKEDMLVDLRTNDRQKPQYTITLKMKIA